MKIPSEKQLRSLAKTVDINADTLLNKFYPVGSIYTSVNNTNPGTIFGGTWERFANGRTLVGVDPDDEDFDAANKTGGDKTVTLTVDQIPKHAHGVNGGWGAGRLGEGWFRTDANNPSTGWGPTSSTGGGQAHNNMSPYITVYFWRRTA